MHMNFTNVIKDNRAPLSQSLLWPSLQTANRKRHYTIDDILEQHQTALFDIPPSHPIESKR